MIISILLCLIVIIMLSFVSAGKEKDFNKFMGNFRN